MGKINKKGVSDDVLMAIIDISIVAILILLGIYIISTFGSNADDNTLSFFNALSDNVQLMIDKPNDFEYQSMALYLAQDHYIFGLTNSQTLADYNTGGSFRFNSDSDDSDYGRNIPVAISVNLPEKCNNQPCLCLYKGIKKFPDKPISCKSFGPDVIFHGYIAGTGNKLLADQSASTEAYLIQVPLQPTNLYSDYPEDMRLTYYNLALNSRDLVWAEGSNNPKLSSVVKDAYIEKFKSGATTHIFITPYLTSDQIKARTSSLSPCPEGSDLPCMGVGMNKNTGNGMCLFDEDQQICVFKDNVAECEVGPRLLINCTCDTKFVEVTRYNNLYCYRRPKDQKLVVLKFDCNTINQCADYCTAITDTAGCVFEEVDYCNQDPCNRNCLAKQNGAKTDCISYYIP